MTKASHFRNQVFLKINPRRGTSIWKQQPLPKTEQGLSKASNDVLRINGENVVTVLDLFWGLS